VNLFLSRIEWWIPIIFPTNMGFFWEIQKFRDIRSFITQKITHQIQSIEAKLGTGRAGDNGTDAGKYE
jgi:hypothetical protein